MGKAGTRLGSLGAAYSSELEVICPRCGSAYVYVQVEVLGELIPKRFGAFVQGP